MEKLQDLPISLHPFQVRPPKTIAPISMLPIPPLQSFPDLPASILQKIGVNLHEQSKQFSLMSFFPGTCSALSCKSASKQTLNEINRQPDLEKQRNQHLDDISKKGRFKQIFMLMVNLPSEKKIGKFEEVYGDFGYVEEKEWRKVIKEHKMQ